MKDLKNLKGAKMLSKNEQRTIKGGTKFCGWDGGVYWPCFGDDCCINETCFSQSSGMCA